MLQIVAVSRRNFRVVVRVNMCTVIDVAAALGNFLIAR